MKFRVHLVWLVLALLPIAQPAFARCDLGEQAIRFGIAKSDVTTTIQEVAGLLRTRINRDFQGRYCLEIFPSSAQFKGPSAVDALKSGTVELAAVSYAELGGLVPDYRIYDLPFAFRDQYALQRFRALVDKPFSLQLPPFGIVSLGGWDDHFSQMTAKRPIYSPSDISGLKFNLGNSPYTGDMMSLLNATAQVIAEADVAKAVKSGRVDAQITHWSQLREDKTALVHTGVTQTNHAFFGYELLVSKKWWDGLDPKLTSQLRTLAQTITKRVYTLAASRATSAKRAIIKSGAPVRALTLLQRNRWLEVLKPLWSEFPDQGMLKLVARADRAP